MARIIIKQPNGLYAEWSTITDSIIAYNLTRDDIIEERIADKIEEITNNINHICDHIDKHGHNPYSNKTWNDLPKKIKNEILNSRDE
ncbi:MAG TPA: hypothetical protein DDY71_11190 [Spirochaetia bacterium]|nr:hypothetical protein [Spirochaetia bacterium]